MVCNPEVSRRRSAILAESPDSFLGRRLRRPLLGIAGGGGGIRISPVRIQIAQGVDVRQILRERTSA